MSRANCPFAGKQKWTQSRFARRVKAPTNATCPWRVRFGQARGSGLNENQEDLAESEAAATYADPVRPAHGHTVSVVTILTIVVSVVGYIREATLAARFGVSPTMDAYFGAILIPYTVYLILILGTLSPVFIPILLQDGDGQDRAKASEAFGVVTTFTLMLVVALVALGMWTAHFWLPWLFPGFSTFTNAILLRLVYVVYPAVVFLALAGILTAVLNGFHKFALASLSPAISSVAVITAAALARGNRAIYIVGVATTVGFLLQFLMLLPAVASLGIRYRPTFDFRHPAVRQLLKVGMPLFLYLAVTNASSIVERNLASRLSSGAVSAVTYAVRLFAVPGSFIAAPLAIVAYPTFAREAARKNFPALREHVSRAFRFAVFLFFPITILLILNALPITRALYERGRFQPQDSLLISRVLVLYTLGLVPYGCGMILLRCFYAVQDTVTPLLAEIVSLVFYVITATWLSKRLGIQGLALARGMTFFLVAGTMVFVLWKKKQLLTIDSSLAFLFLKTVVASAVMGTVSWTILHALRATFDSARTPERLVILAFVMATSITAFLAVSLFLKVREATRILSTASGLMPWRAS